MSGTKLWLVFVVILPAVVFWTTPAAAQQLNPPTDFSGTATGTDTIQWSWTDTNTTPDNETAHKVYDTGDNTEKASAGPDSTSVDETGLSENEQYDRYVKAIGTTGGGEQLDQEFVPSGPSVTGYSVYADQSIAQSFTAGVSGTLTKIQVLTMRLDASTASITIEMRNDSGGLPGTLIDSVSRNDWAKDSTHAYWYDVTFSSTITIVSGQVYWIVLKCSSADVQYAWCGLDGGTYADGYSAVDHGTGWGAVTAFDFYFRDYVDTGSGVLDSDASGSSTRYTLVHDPLDTDVTITTVTGSLDVDISVTPPPNPNADLTGLQIRRGTDAALSDGAVVKSYYAPATTEVYDYTDTVPGSGTYYYGITFRNGDGIETAEYISEAIDVVGDLTVPGGFTGIGSGTTTILWEWTDDVTEADAYLLEDDSGGLIMIIYRPGASYEETVSGENEPATRQLRSAVLGTTTIAIEPAPTGGFTWPWVSTGRHMQMLYLASELSNQAGNITKIYWKLNLDTTGQSYNNVTIKLGHTTLGALGTSFAGNFTEGDDTTVWDTPLYTVPAASVGDWIEIPITGRFYYNGVNSLVFDVNQESGTGDASWSDNNTYTATALYAAPGSSSGTVWDVKFLIQFDMDTIDAKSDPTSPSTVAYSLVRDATLDDFDLTLTGGDTEVLVTITPPPNQDAGSTGVKIERDDDGDFAGGDLVELQFFTNNYSYTDTTVVQGNTYYYRITYCNGDGTASNPSPGDSITVPGVVDTPTVLITDPTGGIYSGDVTITYLLSDPQSDTCSIVVEYSTNDGSTWNPCAEGAGSDGTSGLNSSTAGTTHIYVWETVTDSVGTVTPQAVKLKITPSDTAEGASDTTSFTVDNTGAVQPPVASITDPTSGTHSGNITITYTLADLESDTCGTTVEYSINDGTTWFICTEGGGDGTTGLTSTPGGTSHTFIWDSAADGVGVGGDQPVQVMITPWDDDGEGASDTTSFTVNNVPQEPPVAAITDPTGGTYSGDVTITYTLTDTNSDDCTITAEYRVGTGVWNPCTEGTGGDGTSGLNSSPSPAGVSHTFVWDTVADGVGTVVAEDVQVTITPSDAAAGTSDTSNQFTVDNTGPEPVDADFVGTPQSGNAALTVSFTDASSGTYQSWYWDFGDGSTSTEENPVHTYNLVGTYTVSLTIDGTEGSDTETKVDYITVTDPGFVTAEFSAVPLSGTAPLDVQFTDASVGDIASWAWDFDNDGMVDSTAQNPLYTYPTSGLYTVKLTVTGPVGSDDEIKTSYISVTTGAAAPSKKKGGCSCSFEREPSPVDDMLGYFLPLVLIACAYLALRRRHDSA